MEFQTLVPVLAKEFTELSFKFLTMYTFYSLLWDLKLPKIAQNHL